MLFRKKPEPKTASGGAGYDLSELSLHVLAEVLRCYGEFAFDLDELSANDARLRFDLAARHLLSGEQLRDASPEGDAAAASAPQAGAKPAESSRRDFPKVERWFSEHRRGEYRYVEKSFGDFRSLVWTFIDGLVRSVEAEKASDDSMTDRMARLHEALQSSSTERIVREATTMLDEVRSTMEARQRRQQELVTSLGARLDDLQGKLSQARERAQIDPLTKVYSRASFDEEFERLGNLGQLFGRAASLFMIDVDDFKWVNDKFGHPAGDVVLAEVAQTLKRCFVRTEDFVVRYGGDEFAVLIGEGTLEIAEMLAERALLAVRDLAIPHGEEQIRVTLSIGVAKHQPPETIAQWMERADKALYEAKRAGRDRCCVARS
jgi:diguanylate cyclase (GGDEF)-like protein